MDVIALIKNLTSEELSYLSKGFKKQGKAGKPPLKTSQLFNLILKTPKEELTDEFLHKRLAEVIKSKTALAALKSRLAVRVLEIISTRTFIDNNKLYNPLEQIEARVRRSLFSAFILDLKTQKGNINNILSLLEEVIRESKEYEFYGLLLEALHLKKFRLGFRYGYKEYTKIKEEIEFFKELAEAKTRANEMYFEYVLNQDFIRQNRQEDLKDLLRNCIQQLEASPYTTISSYIQYYYKILLLTYFQEQRNNEESINVCLEIISLLNRNKAINKKDRCGSIYVRLSECYILQREYESALSNATRSLEYVNERSTNYLISQEYRFYAAFYGKQYDVAEEILNQMLSHEKKDSGAFRHDKYIYFSACVKFCRQRFEEAYKICNLTLQVSRDRSGLDLGIRYIKILSLIEMGNFTEAKASIDALRKQISNHEEIIEPRDKEILRVLREYANCRFGEKKSVRLLNLLRNISVKEGEMRWKHFTHELVAINKWIRKRSSGAYKVQVSGSRPWRYADGKTKKKV